MQDRRACPHLPPPTPPVAVSGHFSPSSVVLIQTGEGGSELCTKVSSNIIHEWHSLRVPIRDHVLEQTDLLWIDQAAVCGFTRPISGIRHYRLTLVATGVYYEG